MRRSNGSIRGGRHALSLSLSRRHLLRSSAGAGLGLAAASRLGAPLLAQEDIPREPSDATVEGTLQVLQKTDYHPDHNTFVRAEIEAYCEANGWQVEVSEVGGGQTSGEIAQRLVAGVQAGNAPDLYFDNIPVRQFQELGILEPATDLVNELIGEHGDAAPAFVNGAMFDDEWWGVPWFARVDGWWARNDIFSAAGIDVDSLKTLDERRDAALEVSDPSNNMWGWGITVNRSTDARALVHTVLYSHGSTLQDESGEKVTFNSPESVAALQWLADVYSNEKWAPMLPTGWGSWTDPTNNENFLAGTLALTQNAGTMYAKAVLDKVPFADEIAYLPNPVRNSDGANVDQLGGVSLHIIQGTKNREAVEAIIRHLISTPVQQRIWEISLAYAIPAYKNGWQDPIITETPNAARAEAAVWNNIEFTGLRWPGPPSAAVDAVGGSFAHTDMVAEVIQGRSAEEVVADYHDRFVQIWQDYGLPGE